MTVPKNNEVILLRNVGNSSDDCYEWQLSISEFEALFRTKTIARLNRNCKVLIDEYEVDWIKFEKLELVLETVRKRKIEFPHERVLIKLESQIELALKLKTLVYFMF